MDIYSKEKRSEIMSKIRSIGTTPEKKIRSLLHSLGYRFRLHRSDLPGRPDVVLPKYKTAIFVNGCFWHGHFDSKCKLSKIPKDNRDFWIKKFEKNIERDRINQEALIALGWKVLVIWECEISKTEALRDRLHNYLDKS